MNVGTGFRVLSLIWEVLKVVIISLAIIIPIRYFIVQPFFVNGASMEETFQDGNYILIDEVTYRFNDPVRGDIIVFRYPNDPRQFFIKRVIGLPGETVEVRDNRVTIYNTDRPQGFTLDESTYLSAGQQTLGSIKTKLDDNDYFVMGDNRLHSSDSRYWGAVNRSFITGRVFYRAWPFSEAGPFKDPSYKTTAQ
ncbi:MAG: signal peptidase I [Candidatus Yanofskybacteria bacterium RIFCSPLOWO2_01_FULL_49_25]|uniref:Signal peptidase I n=1 Tax=Candidatus Yanofskybacteria bacterium RIFCSPLOWO2_01_FULL_49_25 TaxID=1802701 RepID=A0A1F8GTF3_9BACT|nr:MAG: signal peptidase I [Candidatus Yanofskybacteria bacterium RIFCSPLOWO2_01_FULL_49_25]